MSFSKLGSEIWRGYETDGVPSSGVRNVSKPDMRAWMGAVEDSLATVAVGLAWSASGWVTATAYAVGDALLYNGVDYRCILAHTSGASSEPGIGAAYTTYWTTVSQTLVRSGTAALPAVAFGVDPDTGLYRPAANQVGIAVGGAGKLIVTSSTFEPVTSDGIALGTSTKMFSDGFFASGAVFNFDNGNLTLTHSAGRLTSSGILAATSFIPSSSTVPTDGMYLPAANTLGWAINSAAEMQLTAAALSPAVSDGNALGTASLMWSDLFLASGAVINFNNGDVLATHSANALAFTGASSGYSFDAALLPSTNDVAALGSASLSWSDLFLASGSVINFNNGDVTVTHASNALTFAGASNGYTFSEKITATGGIVGTATNDNAAAGLVGEVGSSTVARASAVSLTTTTLTDVTTLSLTAGDWEVSGIVCFTANGTVSFTRMIAWLSTAATTTPTKPASYVDFPMAAVVPANTADPAIPIQRMRFSLSATTTIYLGCLATFSASTTAAYGAISARRMR